MRLTFEMEVHVVKESHGRVNINICALISGAILDVFTKIILYFVQFHCGPIFTVITEHHGSLLECLWGLGGIDVLSQV